MVMVMLERMVVVSKGGDYGMRECYEKVASG